MEAERYSQEVSVSDKVKLAVSVDPDIDAAIRKYAEKKECSQGEAVEKLVRTAIGRLNAVHKYAAAQVPAKKKAKAKGPLARKARKAPAAEVAAA